MPTPTRTSARRGRPKKGIMDTHQQVSIYLKPELITALDQQAEREEQQTGRHTNRTDIIRMAIVQYLKAQEAADAVLAHPRPQHEGA
jgi:predicted transcriptional regulator